jgi:hypothetical protein
MKRLASLTTRTDTSEPMRMDKLYPMHVKALQAANLAPNTFPTLGEILDNQQTDPTTDNEKAKKNNQDTRTVQFCLRMSKGWNNPIHAILKELRNKHGLVWLRVSISYHKFSNLREIFHGDLNRNSWMELYLGTLCIGPATATVHQRLMGNVPIMESVGKCV